VARHDPRAARSAADERLEQGRGGRVEVRERLVQQEQLGVVEHRPRGGDALHHPAGQDGDRLIGAARHPDGVEHLLDPLERHVVQPGVEAQVLPRRQIAVEQRLVAEQPDPSAHRPRLPGQLPAQDARGPRVGAQQPGEDAQEGGLARAVGPEHDEGRAGRDGQRDVAEGGALAEAASEPRELNGRLAHGRRG
jgi:hypothetical protein